ncbi:MAG: hypothetical protein MUF64_30230 [Polyangiaceae bacterium]|jgi:hypothetical protein|nr:hypothetical protein [Polyangiaceae bacterium]
MLVVEALEVVDVEQRNREVHAAAAGAADQAGEGLVEPAAVVDPGQPVEHGRLLVALALGHVPGDRGVVGPQPLGHAGQQVDGEGVGGVDEGPEGLLLDDEDAALLQGGHAGGGEAPVEERQLAHGLPVAQPGDGLCHAIEGDAEGALQDQVHRLVRGPLLDQPVPWRDLLRAGVLGELHPCGEGHPRQHGEIPQRDRIDRGAHPARSCTCSIHESPSIPGWCAGDPLAI